jgi:hypothetical protein
MVSLTESRNPLAKRRLPNPVTWELTDKRPRSISGVELQGDNLVRLIYADESGISIHEKITVVAGVIIDADKQWISVKRAIDALINEYVPEEHRRDFVFHAKDLFSGAKIFDRNKYPIERAHEALKKLLSVPGQMRLPIVYGFTRKYHPSSASTKEQRRAEAATYHSHTFALCVLAAERYMRGYADPSEIATVIAENNTDTRNVIKAMHVLLQGRDRSSGLSPQIYASLQEHSADCLPVTRIIDTVHLASKDEAILLQLADACALIIRYALERKAHAEPFFDALSWGSHIYAGDDIGPAGTVVLLPQVA